MENWMGGEINRKMDGKLDGWLKILSKNDYEYSATILKIFRSLHWNYLAPSPISRDYPFKI